MYSQYEEERFILDALKDIPQGRLLDLGASMPTKFSNSRRLIELGWEAVLVDCSPDAIKALATEYAGVWPRVKVVQAAVDVDERWVDVRLTEDFVTTYDPATHEKWKGQVPYYGTVRMRTVPLYNILRSIHPPDFVNVDLEGQSVAVFTELLDESKEMPACICVEYDDRLNDVQALAEQRGYRLTYKNGTNVVLSR